jgi:hypothetical protein
MPPLSTAWIFCRSRVGGSRPVHAGVLAKAALRAASRAALEARAGRLEQRASRINLGSGGRPRYAQCSPARLSAVGAHITPARLRRTRSPCASRPSPSRLISRAARRRWPMHRRRLTPHASRRAPERGSGVRRVPRARARGRARRCVRTFSVPRPSRE